jgi:hypothetical protein
MRRMTDVLAVQRISQPSAGEEAIDETLDCGGDRIEPLPLGRKVERTAKRGDGHVPLSPTPPLAASRPDLGAARQRC